MDGCIQRCQIGLGVAGELCPWLLQQLSSPQQGASAGPFTHHGDGYDRELGEEGRRQAERRLVPCSLLTVNNICSLARNHAIVSSIQCCLNTSFTRLK